MEIKNEGYLQEIAFNYNGDKMAICSSSHEITIYYKKEKEQKNKKPKSSIKSSLSAEMPILKLIDQSEWNYMYPWNIDGPVFRIQWSNPQFGDLIASCGFDKRIMIWKEKKVKLTYCAKIEFSDSVEDISFSPKEYGLKLAAVTLNGMLKIFEPSDLINFFNWDSVYSKDINNSGCSCLCWNPNSFDPQSLVIGCKIQKDNIEESKCNLIQILTYNEYKKQFNIHKLEGCHNNSITDIEWANRFGRNYHLIASTSLDMKLVVWEVKFITEKKTRNFDEINIQFQPIFIFNHDKPLWRCSFNNSAQYLSCIDENGKVFLFLKSERSKFQNIKIF